MTVSEFYVEAASSLREKLEHRTEMQRLMRDVAAGDLVLCDKLDRWSRDPEFTYGSIRRILERGARFYAVSDACDPSTVEGDTMLNFRVLFAREEHKRIKQRMVGTRKILRDQGYFAEGLPPLGYVRRSPKGTRDPEKNALAIDPAKAAIVRRIFALCISGNSLAEISAALGVGRDTVYGVLRRRVYLGEVRSSAGEWIRGKHEPIVDASTFARAQDSIERRRLAGPGKIVGSFTTSDWILRDVAVCAHCGAKMSSAFASKTEAGYRRLYYRCSHKCTSRFVAVRKAEEEASAMVLARLVELREEIARGPDRAPKTSRDYDEELRAVDRRRKRIVEAFEDGGTTRDEMRAKLARADLQRAAIEADRDAARAPSALADASTRRAVYRDIRAIERAWRKAQPKHRRELVRLLASAVKLAHGRSPEPVWFSLEDLAATVSPDEPEPSGGARPTVNDALARTYLRQRIVDLCDPAVFSVFQGVH